jgi:hypothetical protein
MTDAPRFEMRHLPELYHGRFGQRKARRKLPLHLFRTGGHPI